MKGLFIFPVLLIFLIGTPAFADWQKGLDAYEKRDYATALKEMKPLAEQGDAAAQNNLGLMYLQGLGVTQDYARAYMWWEIAASKGNEVAAKRIINVENIMTPAEISKAQDLARECVAKNYKDC